MGGPLLMLVALGSLVGLFVIWVLALRRPAGVEGPRCGKCGYRVEGLETMACPECGGDFRTVGIARPKHVFIHPIVFVLLWSVLLPWPALLVTQMIYRVVPTEGRLVNRLQFDVPGTAMPTVELVQTVRGVVKRGTGVSVGACDSATHDGPDGVTTVLSPPTITGPSSVEVLRFELDLAAANTGASNPAPVLVTVTNGTAHAVDLDTILPWISTTASAAGVTPDVVDDPELAVDVEGVAADLRAVVEMLTAQGSPVTLTPITTGRSTVNTNWGMGYPAWIGYAISAAFFAIYVGGLVQYTRIHRRRTAAARAAADAAGIG